MEMKDVEVKNRVGSVSEEGVFMHTMEENLQNMCPIFKVEEFIAAGFILLNGDPLLSLKMQAEVLSVGNKNNLGKHNRECCEEAESDMPIVKEKKMEKDDRRRRTLLTQGSDGAVRGNEGMYTIFGFSYDKLHHVVAAVEAPAVAIQNSKPEGAGLLSVCDTDNFRRSFNLSEKNRSLKLSDNVLGPFPIPFNKQISKESFQACPHIDPMDFIPFQSVSESLSIENSFSVSQCPMPFQCRKRKVASSESVFFCIV